MLDVDDAPAGFGYRKIIVFNGLNASKIRRGKVLEMAMAMRDYDYGTKASVVPLELSTARSDSIEAFRVAFANLGKDEVDKALRQLQTAPEDDDDEAFETKFQQSLLLQR